MKTANFPRYVVCKYDAFPFEVTDEDWLISITDFNGQDAEVKRPFGRILFMQFDDIKEYAQNGIQSDQADEIAKFIREAKELNKNVYSNCHAGICRSGAIVKLLMENGWEYAENTVSPYRIPNHIVYSLVKSYISPEPYYILDKNRNKLYANKEIIV